MTIIHDTIDPPDMGNIDLPPFLKGPERRKPRFYILPDITRVETRSLTQADNCWTIHYVWMTRVNTDTGEWEAAHVNTRRYKQWLDTYECPTGEKIIPPHIAFGGAVEPIPGGDPEFYNKWLKYARKTFC